MKQWYEQVALVPRSFSKIRAEFQVRVQGQEEMASDIITCCRVQMLFHSCMQSRIHILGLMAGFSSRRVHPLLGVCH